MSADVDPLELASALHVDGQLDKAESLYREVLAARPSEVVARNNLIALLRDLQRWDEAEALLREAIALNPDDAELQYRLALSRLAAGDGAEGWPLFEARRRRSRPIDPPPTLTLPEWDGRPVRELLVWPEPGAADTLMFARYLPLLQARGIEPLLLCQPDLANLIGGAGLKVAAAVGGVTLPALPAWKLAGSLPLSLGLEAPPPPLRFATPVSVGDGVGVAVTAAAALGDKAFALPDDLAAGFLALPGAVSLEPRDTGARTLADVVAVLAGLDHVIATDGLVVHLAAALGKPISLLLPRRNVDWRWMRERADSLWCPSATLYRQPRAGGWRAAVDAVLRDLAPLLAKPSPRRVSPETAAADSAEVDRRRATVAAGETDRMRWSESLADKAAWDERARLAAAFVTPGSRVLDLGCGAMALERFLPPGCAYMPCDLVPRDDRTLVCDFNKGEFPAGAEADIVTVLGVLEYLFDAPAFLAKLRALGRPVVLSYSLADAGGPADRRALGWVNDFTHAQFLALVRAAGFSRVSAQAVSPGQFLFRLSDDAPPRERTVWLVSYNSVGNFGDRLGPQVLAGLLPPNARLTHVRHEPWDAPPPGDGDPPDLLIVGAGGSLFSRVLTPRLVELAERCPQVIGVFGTQYRHAIDGGLMARLLDRLDVWWARNEADALLFGRGRNNVRHLGDLMIDAFPMARWTRDEVLEVGAEAVEDAPLDRLIERFQAYRRVMSPRLHPLLCALTSADEVAFTEQRRGGGDLVSGKFDAMLLDVFGVTKPERRLWPVDRDAVVAYKTKVRRNLETLRGDLARKLGV